MQHTTENTVFDDSDTQQREYIYNFFNTPWDDRGQKSKIGIVSLLCAVFVITMAIVISNLVIFYKGFQVRLLYKTNEINCNLVRVDKYRFAARLHSIASQELICVGAMITANSVLANAVCLESGPIRLYLGSPTVPPCKKGFSVTMMEPIYHDGVITKKLILLTTRENMAECGKTIQIEFKLTSNGPAFIIGRPFRGGRTLSFQRATLIQNDDLAHYVGIILNHLNRQNLIGVKHLSKCPVRAGDLLVQTGRLIGIASTSTHIGDVTEIACFANLSLVRDEIKELVDIAADTL